MTVVKICGITNIDDARLAVECGADALGFNFYEKSSRYVSPVSAKEMIEKLPGTVMKVGIFVNAPIERIVDAVGMTSIDAVQLHGDESPAFVSELRKRIDCEVIKAMRVNADFAPENSLDFDADGILLDSFSSSVRGGTGEKFDWDIARLVSTLVDRLWLAGGLSIENVRTAIAEVRPYAVDACSSLETSPGIKDPTKVREFISEAKRDD